MSLFDFFFPKKTNSASVAKERLQIVLAHQRAGAGRNGPDFLPRLQKELMAVVAKYVPVQDDMIHVTLGKAGTASVLEINIEMPSEPKALKMKAATA